MAARHHSGLAIAFLFSLFLSANAYASLVGVTIKGCTNTVYNNPVTTDPGQCSPQGAGFNTVATVGAGIEFQIDSYRKVDFTADTVSLIYSSGHGSPSPDLFVFTDLIWDGPEQIVGLQLLTSNIIDVSHATDVEAIGLLVNSPLASAGLTTVTYKIVTAVPVPAAVWLFGSALAGLGWFSRKARKVRQSVADWSLPPDCL